MNIYLLLAALAGLLTGIGIEVNKVGWGNINWAIVGGRAALVGIPMIAAVVWLDTVVFISILAYLATLGGYLAARNNLSFKK